MKYILPFFLLTHFTATSQVSPDKGLVAYYPFNKNANDESGNGNNAIFNNAFLVNDRNGRAYSAYSFNGENQYIRIKNSSSINFSGPFSISAWVKVNGFYTGTCHGNRILQKGDADYRNGNYLLGFDDNYFTRGNNCNSSSVDKSHQAFYGAAISEMLPDMDFVQTGKWNLLTYIYDGSSTRLYVNCKLCGRGTLSNYSFSNRADLFFGRLNDDQYPYWFNGVLDEIRIYSRALTSEEIGALCEDKKEELPVIDFICNKINCKTAQFTITKKENIKSLMYAFGDKATSAKENPAHEYKKTGTYTVTLTAKTSNGKEISVTRKVTIELPQARFSYTKNDETLETSFKNEGKQKLKYTWIFGDGETSSKDKKVTHTYKQPGTYTARLVAETIEGCRDTAIQDIVFSVPPPVIIDTFIITRPATPPAVLEPRSNNVVKTIEIKTDSVTVSFYDNGEIDGDIITVLFNKQILASHITLTEKPQTFTLHIDKSLTNNELVMYAENLGSIPPNTALMVIYDGDKRYEVNVNSSKSSNGTVQFRFNH